MGKSYSNGSLLINMGDLSTQGDSLYRCANQELRITIDKMSKLKEKCGWEGQGFDAFFQSYDKKIEKMYQMCNRLSKYGKFLEIASGNFTEANSEVQKDFDNNALEKTPNYSEEGDMF